MLPAKRVFNSINTIIVTASALLLSACLETEEAPEQETETKITPTLSLIHADSPTTFREALPKLKPGDQLLLADGDYKDIGFLQFATSGTPEEPIVIRPKNPHQVTISGELRWRISGSYIVFEGLNFIRASKVPADKKYDSLISSNYDTRGLRFTGCRFISCETEFRENGTVKSNLITLRGDQHRIDNCFFYDPLAGAIGLNGDKAQMEARIEGSLRIDNNIFREMSRLRALEGQGESIFMGTGFSHYRTQPLGAVLEYNIFDRAIGDTHGEIITVKSSNNTFRRNLFVNGPGFWSEQGSHLSLRHTDNCVVTENIFQNLGCGIWVTGRNHKITSNFFIDIDFAGLYFPAGNLLDVVDDESVIMVGGRELHMSTTPDVYGIIGKEYGAVFWAAENCTIENNFFGDLKKFGFYSRDHKRAKHGFIPPKNNRIANNTFHVKEQTEKLPLMHIDQPQWNDYTTNTYVMPDDTPTGQLGNNPIRNETVDPKWATKLEDLKQILPSIPPMPGSLEKEPLRAAFEPFRSTVHSGEYLMLDAAHSAGKIIHYKWNFGDGNEAFIEGNAIAHKWTTPGTYIVKLTTIDAAGQQSDSTRSITVTN